jgi:hypothetical protein
MRLAAQCNFVRKTRRLCVKLRVDTARVSLPGGLLRISRVQVLSVLANLLG